MLMKPPAKLLLALCFAFVSLLPIAAQGGQPIPTLAVPTLVPPFSSPAAAPPTSAVGSIQQRGVFRVGILYNAPPYAELTWEGELRGFDAAWLRLIAETWEVELDFVQVTRQNALDLLNRGYVDAVASAFRHYRHLDTELAFSQSYSTGRQSMMVREDSQFQTLDALAVQPIGYVIGTWAERALRLWERRLGIALDLRGYLTLDQALAALMQGDIEGLAARKHNLLRVSSQFDAPIRILETPVLTEPHAIAVRRRDASMRNLLNRTIQYLTQTGQLARRFNEFFPEQDFPADIVYLWDGIGEESPKPAQFAAAIRAPAQDTIDRMRQSGLLRVAGLVDDTAGLSVSDARLAALNRSLVDEMARRWGVTAQAVPGAMEMTGDLLATGQADLIVGVQPHWDFADAVAFTTPYLLHGDRLMAPANSSVRGFNDLRGQWIGVMLGDEAARERAQAWADSINVSVNFYQTREAEAALTILEFNNADVIYADSLALIPHLEASPNALRLTERWYSRAYYVLGVPPDDIDFRLLVDYTLQEMILDGTLANLSAGLILSDDLPNFDIWPGDSSYAGIQLSAS